jgi:hypothetical protein
MMQSGDTACLLARAAYAVIIMSRPATGASVGVTDAPDAPSPAPARRAAEARRCPDRREVVVRALVPISHRDDDAVVAGGISWQVGIGGLPGGGTDLTLAHRASPYAAVRRLAARRSA